MDRRQFVKLFSSVGLVSLVNVPIPGSQEKVRITNHKLGEEWMLCDGRELDITNYTALFNTFAPSPPWGVDLEAGKFNLPDLRSKGMGNINSEKPLGIFPFMKVKGEEGVPIGTIVNLWLGPDNIEVDENALNIPPISSDSRDDNEFKQGTGIRFATRGPGDEYNTK